MRVGNRVGWTVCYGLFVLLLPIAMDGRQEARTRQDPPSIGIPRIPEDIPLASTPVAINQSETEVRLALVTADGVVEFQSATQPSGEIITSVNPMSDGAFTLLEAVVAADRQSVIWDGHGNPLTKASRDPLERLAAELELMMLQPVVPPHVEWAFRIVSVWAEAPLGFAIERRQTVLRERERRPRSASESITSDANMSEVLEWDLDPIVHGELRAAVDAIGSKCAKGCNVDSDDGIVYLEGNGEDVACKTKSYKTKHDACDFATGEGHCYNSYTVNGGCNRSSGCPGRLGPGCGVTGLGVYTKDALEHDHCASHDSACALCPGDSKCGDEWWDAAGDALGKINCNGCK